MSLTLNAADAPLNAAEIWARAVELFNLYVAVPLGIIGFIFAICQIVQAKNAADRAEVKAAEAKTAAEAARSAAEQARGQFKTLSVAAMLPQLRTLEEAIDQAILARSPMLLAHLIQDWRWHATECRELLDEAVEAEATTMKHIQTSVSASKGLKLKFPEFTTETDWAKETSRLRKAVTDVTANLGALTAQQKFKELQ